MFIEVCLCVPMSSGTRRARAWNAVFCKFLIAAADRSQRQNQIENSDANCVGWGKLLQFAALLAPNRVMTRAIEN